MEVNGMMLPSLMYRHDRSHQYFHPSMTSYLPSSPVYRGAGDVPSVNALARSPSHSTATTPTSSRSEASPFYGDSPPSSAVRGSQAAAVASWRYSGDASGPASSHCVTSTHTLQSCKLRLLREQCE